MPTRLDASYDAATQKVRTAVLKYVDAYWPALGSYRDADAAKLIRVLVPRVEAGQKRIAQLTDAYISRVAAQELGGSISRGTVADVSTAALRGVSAADVYARPFTTVYTALAKGDPIASAVDAGAARLASIAATNMQLAKTHSARNAMKRANVDAFQRVLTGRENCAMCVIASTQRYHRGNLLPIHPGCDCDVKPYFGPDEQIINPKALEQVHGAVLDRFGYADASARDVGLDTGHDYQQLIVTHEHGEIGPVIAVRGHHFSHGEDVAA